MKTLELRQATETRAQPLRRAWWILILPPLLFLLLMLLGGLLVGFAAQGNAETISRGVTGVVPYVLLGTQLLMALFLRRFMRADGQTSGDIGWRLAAGQTRGRELLLALGAAVPLTLVNQMLLLPAVAWLQVQVGDYVPAGAVGETLGATMAITAVSAILLAPLVEESLYRGYATQSLRRAYGPVAVFLIVMLFFGLLHFAQGFWPMLYTMVAHAIFAGLVWWRKNLYAAWLTHLLFNTMELALVLS